MMWRQKEKREAAEEEKAAALAREKEALGREKAVNEELAEFKKKN